MMDTPLLVRDVNHDITEFWSPTRRPPRAPPSSPKLCAYDHDDNRQQNESPTHTQTLAYLDQQLCYTVPHTKPHPCHAVDSRLPFRRFSFQTDCNSCDEHEALDDMHQQITDYNDDGLTLVDTFSPVRSSTSEVNTLSEDAGYESLEPWIQSPSKIPGKPSKPWTYTIPIHRLSGKEKLVHPRSDTSTTTNTRELCASYPSLTRVTGAMSPPSKKATNKDPAMATPLLDVEESRSQVSTALLHLTRALRKSQYAQTSRCPCYLFSAILASKRILLLKLDYQQSWAGFKSQRRGLRTPFPPEPPEKSFWESDSSDDEHHLGQGKEKPDRSRKKFGRRLTDTFRPLFCRS